MPRFKSDPPGPTSVIYMNVRDYVMERVKTAHKEGGQKDTSQSAFLGYLVGIGINVYEKQILTAEKGETPYREEQEASSAYFVSESIPAYGDKVIDISRHAHPNAPKDGVRFTNWDMVILPHMGKVAAGIPIEITGFSGEGIPYPKQKLRSKADDYFTVQVSGTSMIEAGIEDGDYIILKKAVEPAQGRIMLVKHDGDSTLKRVKIKEPNGKNGMEVYLHWEDGSGESRRVDSEDYEIQGEFFQNLGK